MEGYSDTVGDIPDDVTFSGVNGTAGESLAMVERSRASSLEIRVKPPSSCGGNKSLLIFPKVQKNGGY